MPISSGMENHCRVSTLVTNLNVRNVTDYLRHDAFLRFTYKLPDYTAVPLTGRPDGLMPGRQSPYT